MRIGPAQDIGEVQWKIVRSSDQRPGCPRGTKIGAGSGGRGRRTGTSLRRAGPTRGSSSRHLPRETAVQADVEEHRVRALLRPQRLRRIAGEEPGHVARRVVQGPDRQGYAYAGRHARGLLARLEAVDAESALVRGPLLVVEVPGPVP